MLQKIIFLWSALSFAILNGQTPIKIHNSGTEAYWESQEEVFVHYNTSLLFAGESLLYSVHTLMRGANLSSELSKIAYVELVGEDGEVLFRHKVRLTNGRGQGDFFVPSNTPSGNYKLLGYTKWMVNSGIETFFQCDVGIINPFQSDQEILLKEKTTKADDSVHVMNKVSASGNEVTMIFNKAGYGKRQRVLLTLVAMDKNVLGGNYSISIRKRELIHRPLTVSARSHSKDQKNKSVTRPKAKAFART